MREVLFFLPHCTACGILVPDQGSNICPLQWKPGVLTTRPLAKSEKDFYPVNLCTSTLAINLRHQINVLSMNKQEYR